jgi:hypothetical protein
LVLKTPVMHLPNVVVAAFSFATLITACSSSSPASSTAFDCNKIGPVCPNDKPPAASDIAECNEKSADAKCGSLYQAWMQCAVDHPVCDSSGSNEDSAFGAACIQSLNSYETCTGPVDAGSD